MRYNKIMAAGALVCSFAGFGLGLLDVPQEAEAALLPNQPISLPVVTLPATSREPEAVPFCTEADVDMLARLIYTETRGVQSRTEQAAVVWVVLNRLDNPERPESSIAEVVTAPCQFDYRPWVPVTEEFKELAADVLERWQQEKQGGVEAGRVLPPEYQFFEGDGERNYFTAEWRSTEFWDWSLGSPYED